MLVLVLVRSVNEYVIGHVDLADYALKDPSNVLRELLRSARDAHVEPRVA